MKHNDLFIPTRGPTGRCARCGTEQPMGDLNVEATYHHGAYAVECIDRKACGRRRRKAERSVRACWCGRSDERVCIRDGEHVLGVHGWPKP